MSELKQILMRPFSSWLHKQLIDLNRLFTLMF